MKLHRAVLVGAALACFAGTAFSADQKTQDLYKSKCQGCHGADGKATAIGKRLGAKDFQDPDVAKMSEDELEKITKDGKNKMPAYKGKITEQQIDDLVKYIKEMK
jgi:cytochrome c6